PLPDCAAGVACYTATATGSDNTGVPLPGPVSSRSFAVVAATTNITAVLDSATFHSIHVEGRVNLNGATRVGIGGSVHVAVSKPGATGSCTAPLVADSWSCDAPIACTGASPC